MPRWYEVFDNEEVLYRTRSHILWLSGLLLLMVFFGMAITSYLIFIPQPLTLPVISTYAILSLLSVGITLRIYQLRKTVWCIKLSEVDIIGYTHSRRRITLPWEEIKHINLTHHGLLIVSQNPSQKLFIPHAFTSYHVLSHQLVALALPLSG